MEERYYTVVTGKDNFMAQIVNEGSIININKTEDGKEYISGFEKNENVLILKNIVILIPNGSKMGIIPFKDLAFGNEFVTVPISAVTEIYFVNDELVSQIKTTISASKSGIELLK